jgi:UDP-N-acetylmuramoyl-tripeptide--D-alanyl-D-alanine ligase
MEPFPLQWAADRLKVRPIGDAAGIVQHVCIDSRQVEPGSLFFALPGERVDGHRFVAQAFQQGAVGAVVSEELEGISGTLLRVPDTTRALGDLAMHYRAQFRIPVVGITGSVGKTSTKEMTAAVLRTRYRTLANERNYNNEFGVPLTLFGLDKTHEVAVIEMGMRGLGQIDRLAEIARPRIGVITNIGYAHIELLGSQQNIAQAKSELLARLPKNGVAILPIHPRGETGTTPPGPVQAMDRLQLAEMSPNDLFAYLRSRVPESCRILTFGDAYSTAADIALHKRYDLLDGGVHGEMLVYNRKHSFVLHVPGSHHVINAQAALAVACALDIPTDEALGALAEWRGAAERMQVRHTAEKVTVLDDCYNAAPESMAAALKTLVQLTAQHGRRVAILGDMRELGEVAPMAHQVVGVRVVQTRIDLLVTVGALAEIIAATVTELMETTPGANLMPEHRHYADAEQAAREIKSLIRPGDTVLVKGSRAMEMERIVAALTGEAETRTHG